MAKKKKKAPARSPNQTLDSAHTGEGSSTGGCLQPSASFPSPLKMEEMWSCLEAAMRPLASGKTYYFDTRGDLTFTVGDPEKEGTHDFVVCSRTVARWSTVFSAMLFGGFAESRQKGDLYAWKVSLPDDKVAPVFLAFKLIHGSHEDIPQTLKKDELYQLLVVTEKYDMARILRPWAAGWFDPYKNPSSIEGNEILMWMAWELGHEDCFKRLIASLIFRSRVNEDGELLDKEGVPLNTYTCLELPEILKGVAQARSSLIETMSGLIHDVIQTALLNHKCQSPSFADSSAYCHNCYSHYSILGQDSCGPFVFGMLTKLVSDAGLRRVAFPQEGEFQYLESARSFVTIVEKLSYHCPEYHELCNPLPGLQQKVRESVRAGPSPLTEQHLEKLRGQAKKTGIIGKTGQLSSSIGSVSS